MCITLVAKEVSFDSSIVNVSFPPYMCVFEPTENLVKHIYDLHVEIR